MSRDPLRSTLDHLALDPDAGVDRHYLITVLRRLGYTETQIREMVGDPGEEGRIIEVEYTGEGRTRFRFAQAGAKAAPGVAQFSIADDGQPMTFKLAGDQSAGVEELSGVELDDVDVSDDWSDDWSDQEPGFTVDDWGEGGDTEEALESEVEFREAGVVFREKDADLVAFTMEGDDDPALAAGWIEVPDEWVETQDDEWGRIDEAPGDAWPPEDEGYDIDADDEPTWDDGDQVYHHGEYTLYRRSVELTTGRVQDIYFFSKDEPGSGQPSPLPEGYEVAQSEKTGMPFLRKVRHDPSQCGALTQDGKQCRLTAQEDSDYCHVHQGYEPLTADEMLLGLDTAPAWDAEDTLPGEGGHGGPHQCAAITAAGHQCRNTARSRSKYCSSHKGYRAHDVLEDVDTLPAGRAVRDTLPTTAKGGRTRIRTAVIQARSPEEAERLARASGGRVRGVVPVRIEESEVNE